MSEDNYKDLMRFSKDIGISPDRLVKAFKIEKEFHNKIQKELSLQKRKKMYEEVYKRVHKIYGKTEHDINILPNHKDKLVTICDLKTTSKSISDFKDTVDYYNYWLQAAIYCKLVYENLSKQVDDIDSYKILFKFVVVDRYNQVYPFDVSEETLNNWAMSLLNVIKAAEYHYNERNYSLPYEFLVEKVKL